MMMQPMGMYDQQMGQPQMMMQPGFGPQAQADAELAAVEAKQKAREEKEKKKEVEHLTHMMRSGNRTNEDSKACASTLVIWGILNALLWAAPLLGDSWWHKTWQGLSVNKLEIGVGLFTMEVAVECTGTAANDLCKSAKKYADHENGHWTMMEIDKEMCDNVKAACPMMDRLYEAGWFPLCLLPVSAAMETLGILLLYLYWHGMPTALIRSMASKCAVLAPVCGTVAFSGWLLWSPYLQELPRLWAAESSGNKDAANGALFGLKETFMFPMGWCSALVFVSMLSSGVRFFCQFTLPHHIDEPDQPGGVNETAKLMAEAENMYNGEHPRA